MIKDRYSCTVLFVHHTRKEPPGHGYREADLDDMFGSAFIAAAASTIISLKQSKDYTESNKLMDIRYLKSRFTGDNTGFSVVMDGERRVFNRPTFGALPSVPSQAQEVKEKKKTSGSFFGI